MKVKEATAVLRYADKIVLVWDDFQHEYNPQDSVMVEAFGDYKVAFINGYNADGESGTCKDYEIGVAVQPIKEN